MICQTEPITHLCLQEAIAEEAERRRLHRKPFFRQARITRPGDPPQTAPAFCRDIAREGIGLLHDVELEPGDAFVLSIPLIGHTLEIQCQVKWCSRVGDGQYFSGSTYECISSPQSFFLLSAVLGEELNRRVQRRYPFFRPVTIDDEHGHKTAAICRDVSRGGIGLIHREAITPGRFIVSLPTSVGARIVAGAEIRRCAPMGQGWYSSGGRFPIERQPPR